MQTVTSPPGQARWLILICAIPPTPSRHRVRVWRMLRQWGAVALRKSVYLLPYGKDRYEAFAWLAQEIQSVGGEATLLKVERVENLPDEALVRLFDESRREAYEALDGEIRRALEELDRTPRRGNRRAAEAARARLADLSGRLAALTEVDFFEAPGRARATQALERLARRVARLAGEDPDAAGEPLPRLDPAAHRGRLWVTRERPFVDRFASAWLIRRFVDPDARFAFIGADDRPPEDAVPFDLHGALLGHRGEDCTFETLIRAFGLSGDRRLAYLAELVHEADLRDGKFQHAETRGLVFVLSALRRTIPDDHRLLEEGMALFERVYESLGERRGGARPEETDA